MVLEGVEAKGRFTNRSSENHSARPVRTGPIGTKKKVAARPEPDLPSWTGTCAACSLATRQAGRGSETRLGGCDLITAGAPGLMASGVGVASLLEAPSQHSTSLLALTASAALATGLTVGYYLGKGEARRRSGGARRSLGDSFESSAGAAGPSQGSVGSARGTPGQCCKWLQVAGRERERENCVPGVHAGKQGSAAAVSRRRAPTRNPSLWYSPHPLSGAEPDRNGRRVARTPDSLLEGSDPSKNNMRIVVLVRKDVDLVRLELAGSCRPGRLIASLKGEGVVESSSLLLLHCGRRSGAVPEPRALRLSVRCSQRGSWCRTLRGWCWGLSRNSTAGETPRSSSG